MNRRRLLPILLLVPLLAVVGPAHADLQSQITSSRGKDHALQRAAGRDAAAIAGFEGRVDDLRRRLGVLQGSLDDERAQMASLQTRLRAARARLAQLRLGYARDKQLLAGQLVAGYEADRPDLVTVVLHAHGFSELLDTADSMRVVARHNAAVADRVRVELPQVARQARALAALTAQQRRVTTAALVQRDEVDRLKIVLLGRESRVAGARASRLEQLAGLRRGRKALEARLASIQAAQTSLAGAGPGLPSGGAPGFAGHGGAYGFFPAPATNYGVGSEPTIAARLDVMGKALHLRLIGLSGYRSPQHSIEVGGFANDPHTKGQASDTPGLEGVPEGTLTHYGLTRPFPGAAEADHVQLVGSI